MWPEYQSHNDLSKLLSIHVIPAKSNLLSRSTNTNSCVTSLGLRQVSDKIHSQPLPLKFRHRQWLQHACRLLIAIHHGALFEMSGDHGKQQ